MFTIDEVERPDYKPRTPAINGLLAPPLKPVDVDALQEEKDLILKKLDIYKRKLSRGLPETLLAELFANKEPILPTTF